MNRNITLAIDEELLRQARRYAAERDTTVNGLVRDYLSQLVARREQAAAARQRLLSLSVESEWQPGTDWHWDREAVHERGDIHGHQHPGLRGVAPKGARDKKKTRT